MSQKMLAAVYGVDLRTISYHITKIFKDAELDEKAVIQKYWITADDGKNYHVNHYNLQVIIALGFKIDNERAIAFRKWANQIVSEYTIKGWVLDVPRLKDGSPITDEYFEHQLERIREIRLTLPPEKSDPAAINILCPDAAFRTPLATAYGGTNSRPSCGTWRGCFLLIVCNAT